MSHPQRRWTEEEVTRHLRAVGETSTPEPPADLLENIQAEIPAEFFPPEQEIWLTPRRSPHLRHWFAAAAVVALAITGGWIALQTMETAKDPAEHLAQEPPETLQEVQFRPPPVTETLGEKDQDDRAALRQEKVRDLSGGGASPAPPPPPPPSAPVASSEGLFATGGTGRAAPAEPEAGRIGGEQDGTVRKLDEYKMPKPAAKRISIPDPSPGEPDDMVLEMPLAPPVPVPPAEVAESVQGAPDGDEVRSLRRQREELEREYRALQRERRPQAKTEEAAHRGGSPRVESTPAPPTSQGKPEDEPMRRLAPVEPPPAPAPPPAPPSTGGTAEPNDQPYGDVFFESAGTNPFIDTEDDRLSTFGFDVDTGSYTVIRRYLTDGHRPPRDAVRVEEMINFFKYGDRPPTRGDFALHAEGAPSFFGQSERYHLLRFNVRGREVSAADRKPALLTFVVDVSGSMNQENRLGLVKRSLGMLLEQLRREDQVALVVFGSQGRVLLPPTSDKVAIGEAIARLRPEGATNAEEGLVLGYQIAARNAEPGIINRVILCSDGVANVGNTGPDSILQRIRRGTEQGIELTTLGFGMGNYNDVLMEQLADQGDGRYAYIDTLDEAHRILVEELTGTLQTIASEARAQVEFNPQVVERYRLIGYENRDIADHRFRDDTVDAGEIGAGHSVTALYEVKLAEGYEPGDRRQEVATLHVRYRSQESGRFEEVQRRVTLGDFSDRWETASPALRLTALVAEFGEILKGSYWARGSSLDEVFRRTQALSSEFTGNRDVAELVALMGRAASAR